MTLLLLLVWCSGCRWKRATSASTPQKRVDDKPISYPSLHVYEFWMSYGSKRVASKLPCFAAVVNITDLNIAEAYIL
jgi:hypothetical protein